MHDFGTTNCEKSGTPDFPNQFGTVLFIPILFLYYGYAAKPYAGKLLKLCEDFAVIFRCFEAEFMGSKFSKTAEVFPECSMAESPKSAIVETEGVSVPPGSEGVSAYPVPETGFAAVPPEGVATEIPGTTTAEEQSLPVVPASKVTIDLSPAAPPTPMTPDEGGDDDVLLTQKAKKPKLHQEISALGECVSQAVDAMNTVSKAMVDMCSEYKRERERERESCRSQFAPWDSKESRTRGISRPLSRSKTR